MSGKSNHKQKIDEAIKAVDAWLNREIDTICCKNTLNELESIIHYATSEELDKIKVDILSKIDLTDFFNLEQQLPVERYVAHELWPLIASREDIIFQKENIH